MDLEKNLSAVLHGKYDLRVENRPTSLPKDDEVLVRMAFVGICGTDITLWTKGGFEKFQLDEPITLGHETSGVVVKAGKDITHLLPGDFVAVEPLKPCRKCDLCKVGRKNLCRDLQISGLPSLDGGICRYRSVRADYCHKLPPNVPLDIGALSEPLSIAVHACERGEITLGHKVLITGAGPIGLLSLVVSRYLGAAEIIVTDVNLARLRTAYEMGATRTILVQPGVTEEEDIIFEVVQTFGDAPDVTIECSAKESAVSLAMNVTKKGGKVVLVGIGSDLMNVPLQAATVRQVDMLPIFCYTDSSFKTAVSLLGSSQNVLQRLITHRIPLENVVDAFEMMRNGTDGAIKVMIEC